jgi:hypothetical protein
LKLGGNLCNYGENNRVISTESTAVRYRKTSQDISYLLCLFLNACVFSLGDKGADENTPAPRGWQGI